MWAKLAVLLLFFIISGTSSSSIYYYYSFTESTVHNLKTCLMLTDLFLQEDWG